MMFISREPHKLPQKDEISNLGKQIYRMPAPCALTPLSKVSFLFRGVRENRCHRSAKEACSEKGCSGFTPDTALNRLAPMVSSHHMLNKSL